MWYKDLFDVLEKNGNNNQAIKMSEYMQNKFVFLGISKPKLKELEKEFLKESKKYELDWNFIDECYKKDYREAQYVAIDYLKININKLSKEDFQSLKKLIITKSWWETVDSIDVMIGHIIKDNPNLEKSMIEWSISDNIWLRRVSIDFQQEYKEKTNTELLEKIIVNNLESNEFFINKAIGWSLRDYSKVNPDWVKKFIDRYKNRMNKLSIREASKFINV